MLLDLETSFEEMKGLDIAEFIVLPINASIEPFKDKIEKKISFPCWLKLNSGEHKLSLGAVEKCSSFQELEKKYKEMQKKFPSQKFIIQKDAKGIEVIAGIKNDKTFSKVLLVGSGGTLAELIKDIKFRVLPASKEEILESIKHLRIFPMLLEKKYNIESLVNLIKKFSDLELEEADLNPIIVNDKQALVVDARINIGD